MIEDGIIGKLQSIRAEYGEEVLPDTPKEHWVFGETFGGCAYDIGVYPISFAHFFAGRKMRDVTAQTVTHPDFPCDFGMQADIIYEN